MPMIETTYHDEYQWPFWSNFVRRACKPSQPEDFLEVPVQKRMPICGCGQHPHESNWGAYKDLSEKHQRLCREHNEVLNDVKYQDLSDKHQRLCHEHNQVLKDMAKVTCDILDDPCGDRDNNMATIYQIDYDRKGLPKHPPKVEEECPAPSPPVYWPFPEELDPRLKLPKLRTPIETSIFDYRRMPSIYHTPYPGRTEYQDELSIPAAIHWKQCSRRSKSSSRRKSGVYR